MDLIANHTKVKAYMKGRLACSPETAVLLQKMVLQYDGDYVEIGTLFGGSLVLAGMLSEGSLYAIDPLDGYYRSGKIDRSTGLLPSKEIVEANLRTFGVKATIFQQHHPPWPEALKDHRFGVGFIDGNHTYEGCLADYEQLKGRCKCLVFDNTEKPSVHKVVDGAVSEGWKIVGEASGIYERKMIEMIAVSNE